MRLRLKRDRRIPDRENLQCAIERNCGRKVRQLVRFSRGASSFNYLGCWADDGSRFVVKLIAPSRYYDLLVSHLEGATDPVVKELRNCPRFDFGDYRVIFTEWCAGTVLPFDSLLKVASPEDFLADYERFAQSIQATVDLDATPDYVSICRDLAEWFGPSLLPRDLDGEDLKWFGSFVRSRTVVHGDFQADNLRFEEGRLVRVLDIAEFRHGHPVEDFVRYACCSAGHLPWFAFLRRRRIIRNLGRLASVARFESGVWKAAIYANWLYKLRRYRNRKSLSRFRSFWLKRCLRFYERMARAVAHAARVFDADLPRLTPLMQKSDTFASKE